MFVLELFRLNYDTELIIRSMKPVFGFNGFGELVFYRTYSRTKADGTKENWNDVVIRVINGLFSIRKDWYIKNHIEWDEDFWQHYATHMAYSMFKMEWLPPGRGLWAMGTDYIYERGSMASQNCGYSVLGSETLSEDIGWVMDALMCGVGVGFTPERDDDLIVYQPEKRCPEDPIFKVEDSREGWVESTEYLIKSYLVRHYMEIEFDYSDVRPKGLPIKGFGGISSGPDPLIKLHKQIRGFFESFTTVERYDSVRLKTDLANAVGCAVVSGNVRRSAQLSCCPITDPTFLDLKDYILNPDRQDIGWMSNNSVILEQDSDFELMGAIASRVIRNGEPGVLNKINMAKGRIGHDDGLKKDPAIGINPCGEIPLLDKGICCLVETLPTCCKNEEQWLRACEYATVYASTVTLLPTHSEATNRDIAKHRRIGVGIIDVSGWKHSIGTNQVIKWLRLGYNKVRSTNRWVNEEAGVPEALRVTCTKPGGTVPKLAGKTSGISHPNFTYTLRRIRIAANSGLCPILDRANIPYEADVNEPLITRVYEFPILQGPAKQASEVTLWEQASNLIMMQREWADNAVSNTLNFGPHEVKDIEAVLSSIAPFVKSVSMMPHSDVGVYKQMPEQGLTSEEYNQRLSVIKMIDYSNLRDDAITFTEPEKFCEGEICLRKQ